MNIVHFADLHHTNNAPVLADIVKCEDFALKRIEHLHMGPFIITIAGDLFDEAVQLGSPASLTAINFIHRCGNIAPTILVKGTSTHDVGDCLAPLDKLKTAYPVYVTDELEQVMYCHDDGFLVNGTGEEGYCCEKVQVLISCLPSVNKAGLMAAHNGGSIDETKLETEGLLRDVFQAWGILNGQARKAGIPTILVGHGTVTGSETSTGQVMIGRDLEFSVADLQLARCDLYCLGHIHKAQILGGNIFYAGAITRLTFAEEEEKGFYIHELSGNDNPVISTFIPTPARSMVTKRPAGLPDASLLEDVKPGDNVRIVYEVAQDDVARVDEAELERQAIEKGAGSVKIERTIIPTVRTRAEGISQEHTSLAKLRKWGETTGTEITAGLDWKLALLEDSEVETITASYEEAKQEEVQNAAA